ncbi:hypothetical protein NY2A_b054R [Paramecium bursaria Chlorella virus NY2A]|uniref:Uncharacterized protein b054R n=1 Tax=Paramecium bursaria Chlorella virus NY2A TaxID=46021 RepID=A7IVS9_PBCVN|nr:hypothetical protein NY2A_b054R [Paramecium bursaria Chlorella virus NY2A]ABT14453.1 hypothetical protein NY2A_b054R [Paramecium bursaria Chlorella virus NY2A]
MTFPVMVFVFVNAFPYVMKLLAPTFAAFTFPGAKTFPLTSAIPVDGNPTTTPSSLEALPMSVVVYMLPVSVIFGPEIFPTMSAVMSPGTSTIRFSKNDPFPMRYLPFTFPDTDTYCPDRIFPTISVVDTGAISAG